MTAGGHNLSWNTDIWILKWDLLQVLFKFWYDLVFTVQSILHPQSRFYMGISSSCQLCGKNLMTWMLDCVFPVHMNAECSYRNAVFSRFRNQGFMPLLIVQIVQKCAFWFHCSSWDLWEVSVCQCKFAYWKKKNKLFLPLIVITLCQHWFQNMTLLPPTCQKINSDCL